MTAIRQVPGAGLAARFVVNLSARPGRSAPGGAPEERHSPGEPSQQAESQGAVAARAGVDARPDRSGAGEPEVEDGPRAPRHSGAHFGAAWPLGAFGRAFRSGVDLVGHRWSARRHLRAVCSGRPRVRLPKP